MLLFSVYATVKLIFLGFGLFQEYKQFEDVKYSSGKLTNLIEVDALNNNQRNPKLQPYLDDLLNQQTVW